MEKIYRRDFLLPEEDIQFLNKLGLPWETISNAGLWLIIYDYPIPVGYNVNKAEIALNIPSGYDAAQIDMAYFHPHLLKLSGRLISATVPHPIDGKSFQRWSRHRQPNEWVPGIDNVSTHLSLVDNWLEADIKR